MVQPMILPVNMHRKEDLGEEHQIGSAPEIKLAPLNFLGWKSGSSDPAGTEKHLDTK